MFGNPPEAAVYIAGKLSYVPGKYNDSFIFAHTNPEKAAEAHEAYLEAQYSLNCHNGCRYYEICAARDKQERYPLYAGGKGGCLRYFERVEGLRGFYLPDGRPLILTDDAVAALRESLKQTDEA